MYLIQMLVYLERLVDDLFLCGKHLAEHYVIIFALFKLNTSSLHRNCYLLKPGNAVPV